MALTTRLPSSKVAPFNGFVETTGDALRLIQAARQGIIPRITRRLNDLERRAMIRSGSIFIFSDEESGIKRWTEGLSWSASRIVGNFLVYREVLDRSCARAAEGRRVSKRRANAAELSPAEIAEQKLSKSLVGCLSDNQGRFKPNGLIKKTITVVVEGSDHHLIAYYSQEDVRFGKLPSLSSRHDIMSLSIPPELLESTKFRVPPVVEDGPDGRPRYIRDADDADQVPFPTMHVQSTSAPVTNVHPFRPRLHFPTNLTQNHQLADATSYRYPSSNYYSQSPSQSDTNHSIGSAVSPMSSLDAQFRWLSAAPASASTVTPGLSAPTRSAALGGAGDQQQDSVLGSSPFPREGQGQMGVPYQPLLTSNLADHLAWSGAQTDSSHFNGAFMLAPGQGSPITPHDVQHVVNWMGSENGSLTDSQCSSLPCTPTQPRQTSCRFTSLPSSYQHQHKSESPTSTIFEPQPNNLTFELTDGSTHADYDGKVHWC